MSEQYWVGGFFIDLSRNQITQNKQSQTLAPKALSVLTYLAQNHGKVVSHDELLTEVWQGTIVSPNTLQRSIAQLRKALGDEGKIYIKTHAKQGYSLECDVRWHDVNSAGADTAKDTDTHPDKTQDATSPIPDDEVIATPYVVSASRSPSSNHSSMSSKSRPSKASLLFIAASLILAVVGFTLFLPNTSPAFAIDELRLLTSTDNKEMASIYSPDGEYVVFHRYSEEFCINNIWAKNTQTQEEIQLTQNLDSYGSHSFSKDGKKLVFIKRGDCSEPVFQKLCYTLMILDFNLALTEPQLPNELMECINSSIKSPSWLNNNTIALLKKESNRWKLIRYSLEENTSDTIYTLDDGNIIDYDYSPDKNLIALTALHSDGLYYIEILNPDGEVLSSHPIQYPKEIADFRFIYPNFSPLDNQLVFSTGRQLFTLSYTGQITNISLPIDEPMGSPVFHPAGNRMLVIKGHYDSDIVSIPVADISQNDTPETTNEVSTSSETISRSTLGEESAMFQPNGEFIAFESERSGEDQIWLSDGKGIRQLSQFPMDTAILGMDWAQDGDSILANVTYELIQVFLDGTQRNFAFGHRIETLFQWNSKTQTALAKIRYDGVLKFAQLDLANGGIRIVNDKKVNWALESDDGTLIYTDHLDRFWRPGPAEDIHISALDGQGSNKRFVINDGIIWGVNSDNQLWSYSLDDNHFTLIGDMPRKLDYLTDKNADQLLLTMRVSSRKEVAEIALRD